MKRVNLEDYKNRDPSFRYVTTVLEMLNELGWPKLGNFRSLPPWNKTENLLRRFINSLLPSSQIRGERVSRTLFFFFFLLISIVFSSCHNFHFCLNHAENLTVLPGEQSKLIQNSIWESVKQLNTKTDKQ